MPQKREEFQKAWGKIVAKAWSDPAFKKRLIENPNEILKANGIEISSGVHVVVKENTKDTFHLCLPEKPVGELSEEKLREVAAGNSAGTPAWICQQS